MNTPRKLAPILVADIAGYSRLTSLDAEGTRQGPLAIASPGRCMAKYANKVFLKV
jgi:hypothetical protein